MKKLKISEVKNIIETNTDKNRYNTGVVMYKNNLVSNAYVKKDTNNVNFYATVSNEHYNELNTTLIIINDKTHRLVSTSCDCNDWLSKSGENHTFICKHMVATIFKCIDELSKKKSQKSTSIKPLNNNEISYAKLKVVANIDVNENNQMNFNFKIGNLNKSRYKEIYNTYKENKRLYKLKDSIYLDLHDKEIRALLELIDIIGVSDEVDNIKLENNKALYIDNYIKENKINFVTGKQHIQNITDRFVNEENYESIIPKDLENILRDYQKDGVNWFNNISYYKFGGILADEMGLGKTIQTIAFTMNNKGAKNMIITPTSLIHNWKSEFDKFAPNINVGIVHGDKKNREKIIENTSEYDVLLTTYSTIRNDLDKYKDKIFDCLIIDEAQNIKNPDAISTKSVKSINSNVRFALTGTPIENNLIELWSIFDFIMPGYLYDRVYFQNKFLNKDSNKELKSLIKPFILRRTKKQVIKELPDKIEKKFIVELNKEQKKLYDIYNKSILEKLENNSVENDKITIFSYLTKLRQLCLHPGTILKDYKGKSSKVDVCMDILKEAIESKRKILLFSQFTSVLKLIQNEIEKENIKFVYLDGKTKAENRVELVNEFNENNEISVFLISLKAGGTGLNLTSADMVIHFDPWWNIAVENQASDRAHRLGQKNVVEVIKLISKDTIEEKIIDLQENKRELIENIIDDKLSNSKTLNKLSKEELIELFK
ncbi:SNF2-related protein [Paraclostridium sp.]|uniref:DEAD/DEAH box helicase n=1 Tax=Paraclostridium sp. TaxID=2023273 RepID=UPI003F6771B2